LIEKIQYTIPYTIKNSSTGETIRTGTTQTDFEVSLGNYVMISSLLGKNLLLTFDVFGDPFNVNIKFPEN